MNLIETLEREAIDALTKDKPVPEFRPGDTLRVGVKVIEGDRTRVQAFEGVCIARANKGVGSSFTVRKISFGEGVERLFPVMSPMIESIVGRTLDIGLGGLRVLTLRPVPKREPTVMFTLPTGRSIVGATLVLSEDGTDDGYEVRLAFQDLDPDDVVALRELVEAYTA